MLKALFCPCFLLLGVFAADAEPLSIGPRAPSLGEIGNWTRALKSPDRAKALAAAHDIGVAAWPGGGPLLVDFYRTGDTEFRLAATQALLTLNDREEVGTLVNIALFDRSQHVRQKAADCAKTLVGAQTAFDRFQSAVDDAEKYTPLIRQRALHAAARVNPARAEGLLRSQLSADPLLACAAAEELGYCATWAGIDDLIAQLGNLDAARKEVRLASAEALQRRTGKTFAYELTKWSAWRSDARAKSEELPSNSYADSDRFSVDVVIAFDTTGSFVHAWSDISRPLEGVMRAIQKLEPGARFGLIRYRAVTAAALKYTLWPTPLSFDLEQIQREMDHVSFGGGSGALHEALRYALDGMAWREHARKIIVVIGDDTPQSPVEHALDTALRTAQEAAAYDSIQFNTLYVVTSAGEQNRAVYAALANAGRGRFYEYNRAFKHLMDSGVEKPDIKNAELPEVTAKKWLAAPVVK